MSTGSQRLLEIEAQKKALAEEEAKILNESREADLETIKRLIKAHSFSPTDLRGVLKPKRKSTAKKSTTVKKAPAKTTAKK